MLSRLSILKKGAILVLVPLAFECIFVFALLQSANESLKTLDSIEQSRQQILELSRFSFGIWKAIQPMLGQRDPSQNFIIALADQVQPFFAPDSFMSRFCRSQNPEFSEEITSANNIRKAFLTLAQRTRELAANSSKEERARIFLHSGKRALWLMTTQYEDLMARIEKRETEAATYPKPLDDTVNQFYWLLAAGLTTSLTITIVLIYVFNKNISDRLKELDHNATAILMRKPLKSTLPGTDELARLDAELHEAAAALEFARQREFAVLEKSNDVICALDSKLTFRSASPAMMRAWNYDESDVLGRSLLTLVVPRQRELIRRGFDQIAAETQGSGELEFQILCADKTAKEFVWSVLWSQAHSSFYCVAHDVSKKRAIERLRESFLSMVSHDLRAPLNAIIISVALLETEKRGQLPDRVQDELEEIEEKSQELIKRLDNLLSLAKSASPQFDLQYRSANAKTEP